MTKGIQLKIILPSKVWPAEHVEKVIIPAFKGGMTVLNDRAPTTVLLTNGVLEVLDQNSEALKKYFIQGGVANIAADECVVMTERALSFTEATAEKIQELKDEHLNELKEVKTSLPTQEVDTSDGEIKFYDFILEYLSIHKKS